MIYDWISYGLVLTMNWMAVAYSKSSGMYVPCKWVIDQIKIVFKKSVSFHLQTFVAGCGILCRMLQKFWGLFQGREDLFVSLFLSFFFLTLIALHRFSICHGSCSFFPPHLLAPSISKEKHYVIVTGDEPQMAIWIANTGRIPKKLHSNPTEINGTYFHATPFTSMCPTC